MAQAGVAYVEIRPDWAGFNREIARGTPGINRQAGKLGKQISGEIGRNLGGLSSSISRQISGALSTGAKVGGVAFAAGLVGAVKSASNFEQQLSSLGSVSGASAREMEAFRKAAIKAGADTKFSALDAAKAQTELAKGGLANSEILKGGLASALALAAAGEIDLAQAAATTVNSMKLFGIRGSKSIKVADALATAANSTTADVSDFALALNQAGSAAKTVGLSFPETITALEALAEVGIKGSDAGTSLKTALVQLASPSSIKAVETAKELGINVFDAKGNIKSLVGVSKELQDGLGGLTKEQRIAAATTLVGQDGFRALLALYDAGPTKIQKLQDELNKQGTAADVAKKKQDNLKGSIEQFGGSLETVGIQVGTLMIPAIRRGADELTDFAGAISKILERDDLDFGEKLAESLKLAKVNVRPWVDKLEKSIVEADIPGRIGDVLSGGSGRIGEGFDASPFATKILEQVEDANLPEKIGDLLSAAAPKIAAAIAGSGVLAAEAFAKAFISADAWGKLLIGGWLLSKMGGVKAFRALGATAAINFNAGATGALTTGTTTGKTAKTVAARQAVTFAALTAGSPLPAGTGPGFTHGSPLDDRGAKQGLTAPTRTDRLKTINAGARGAVSSGLGKLPIVAAVTVPFFELEAEKRADTQEKAAEALARAQEALEKAAPNAEKWKETADAIDYLNGKFSGSVDEFNSAEGALTRLGLSLDSKPEEIAKATEALDGLKGRFEVAQRLFAKGISLPSEVTEDDAKNIAAAIERMSDGATGSIKSLRTNVRLNTKLIKNALGKDTEEGKEALAANFRAAAENVKRSMEAGTIATKEGTAEIRRLLVLSLGQFGFSKDQALNIIKTGDDQGNKGRERSPLAGRQTGGMVVTGGSATVPGSGSGDKVHLHAMVEPGEDVFVLNRNASTERRRLQSLNAAVPRFQTGGLLQRLAGGGSVTGDIDFVPALLGALRRMSAAAGVPIFVQSGRRTVAEQLAQGPSTPGHPVAGPNGPHVRGVAADMTPGYPVFGKLASRFGLGFTVMPQEPWHIQLLDAAQAAVETPEIKRLLVDGPESPLKRIVQGAVDTSLRAAQQVVERAAESSTANGSEAAVPSNFTGTGADLMRQISDQRGWNFSDWWALDAKETGHGANLTNPTSTARLRGQFLDSNWGKYGPGSDPGQNPTMAQQILSMANYIDERYGNPTKALDFHNANNYYQRGGLVGAVSRLINGGAPRKGRLPAGIDLSEALSKITAGRTDKLRDSATKGLLDSINGIGFAGQAAQLSGLSSNAALYGENADRAGRLTDSGKIQDALEGELARRQVLVPPPSPLFPADDQQAIVNTLLGRVGGGTQLDWLTKQLTSLFDWRNVIVDTDPIVTQLRDDAGQLLRDAEAKMATIAEEIQKAEQEYARIEKERDRASKHEDTLKKRISTEMDKPARKRDESKLKDWREDLVATHAEHVALNQTLSNMRGEKRVRERVQAGLNEDVIPALTEKRDNLEDAHGDLLGNLVEVQGLGGPTSRLAVLPPLGTLGGTLFDVGSLIQDLTDNPPRIEATVPAVTENQQKRADLLKQLLDEANLRATVADRAFSVFKGLPYGGEFEQGGTVPGRRGQPVAIVAHGGEEVIPVEGAAAGGTIVHLHFRPGTEWLRNFVDVRVEQQSRGQARRAARALPGIGGGNLR